MKFVVGIDEVGRGPLAGPVCVGVVVMPENINIWSHFIGLRDSKKLSEKKREEWYAKIIEDERIEFATAMVSAADIDALGIVPSIHVALTTALKKCSGANSGCKVVLDAGLRAPEEYKNQKSFVRGDENIPAIALASIVAKVERDRFMVQEAEKYPEYGFGSHKGYGTAAHCAAIRKFGLSEFHRQSFCSKLTT